MVTAVTVTIFRKTKLNNTLFCFVLCSLIRTFVVYNRKGVNMMNKEEAKDRNRLEVALDHETSQLIAYMAYNWEVAASRMEQIVTEREQGRYDDDGTEAMAVFSRLQHVLSTLFAVNGRPQAVLLRSYRELLEQMAADDRMNRGIADMMTGNTQELSIQAPTIWKRLSDMLPKARESGQDGSAEVRELYQKNYLPNMDANNAWQTMQALVNEDKPDEQQQKDRDELFDALVYLGENLGKIVSSSKQLMGMGMACVQMAVKLALDATDLRKKEDADVDAFFQAAKEELLASEAWQEYWHSHIGHLSQKGSLKTELHKDAVEVKQDLLDVNRYLYTKMEESAEAFGHAIKEAGLSDNDMLRLLWLAAKKEAIEKEQGPVNPERGKMEKGVCEAAQKLKELAADKYYDHYDEIWDDIVLSDIIASLLKDFGTSVHNAGFNMQVFCHIVGWLQENYKFYGQNTSVTLGKSLNDGKQSDTFKKYIGSPAEDFNQQTINELAAIVAKERA